MNISKEIATKAARWWVSRLDRPKDTGDRDDGSDLMNAMLTILSLQETLTTEMEDRFVDEFVKIAIDAGNNTKGSCIIFSTDYAPNDLLLKVFIGSETPSIKCPIKTCMKIYEDHIVVKDGYGKPLETL